MDTVKSVKHCYLLYYNRNNSVRTIGCIYKQHCVSHLMAVPPTDGTVEQNLLEVKAGVRYKQEPEEIGPPIAVNHRLQQTR